MVIPGGIYVYKILYDRQEQRDCTAKALKFWMERFERIQATGGDGLEVIYASLKITMDFFIPLFKHPCYENEQENRLVLDGQYINHEKINFQAKKGYFKPYIDIEIGASRNEVFPLDTVMVGPTTPKQWSDRSLRMFLDNQKLESTKIERSDLPYRGNFRGSS